LSIPATAVRLRRIGLATLLALAFIATTAALRVPYVTAVAISALLFGLFGAVYDFMIGVAGLANFGFAGFIAVGAYTSALCATQFGITPWAGLLLGGLGTAAVGLLTGLVTLRLRGLYLGMITWFVGEVIRLTISNTPDYTRGMLGLSVPSFPNLLGIDFSRGASSLSYFYLLVLLGAAIMLALWLVVRSPLGLAFKALREDQLATESLGLNATKYKLVNFTIASFLTGVLGAFYAHYLGILTPTPEEFGVPRTVQILTIAYVGGRGSLWGALAAAVLLIGVQEYFRGIGAYRLIIFGALLIAIMLFAPKGIAGLMRYLP
jgi:branched-chain amino acid transport system permease protein